MFDRKSVLKTPPSSPSLSTFPPHPPAVFIQLWRVERCPAVPGTCSMRYSEHPASSRYSRSSPAGRCGCCPPPWSRSPPRASPRPPTVSSPSDEDVCPRTESSSEPWSRSDLRQSSDQLSGSSGLLQTRRSPAIRLTVIQSPPSLPASLSPGSQCCSAHSLSSDQSVHC